MSSSRAHNVPLCVGGGPLRLTRCGRRARKLSGGVTSSDVRGNTRGMKSGRLRTALQIPGLQPAAIVWAPEDERRKQGPEIWRHGLFVTQAWPILDDAIKYLVCESLMKLE